MEPKIWTSDEVIQMLELIKLPQEPIGIIEHIDNVITSLREDPSSDDSFAPGPSNQTTD
jgi:hypothetical protein